MPDEIDQMIAAGTLEQSTTEPGYREYVIPALQHRKPTWLGWQDIIYCLIVDDDAQPGDRYTIESQSESSGNDTILTTDAPDEVEAWIAGYLKDRHD